MTSSSVAERFRRSRLATAGIALFLVLSLLPLLPAQPASAASGPISVSLYDCPAGYDAGAAPSQNDLSANCVSPVPGASFTVSPDAGGPAGFVTDAGGFGALVEVPPGGGTLALTALGTASSRVFCFIGPQGAPGGAPTEFPAGGNAIAYNIGDGQEMACSWFTYQAGAVLIQGEVTIRKYLCPVAYDASAAPDLGTLQSNCTDPGGSIPFSVIANGQAPVEGSTDGSGFGIWPGVTAGPGVVREGPVLYQQARVFCDFYDIGNPGAAAAFVEYPAAGNEIGYDLPLGQGLSCWWFNWDPVDESFVNVFKLGCPEGYDWAASDLATLKIDCITPLEGVAFNLAGPGLDDTKLTDNTGLTGWNVDPGDYVLTETLPAGYGALRVFCGTYPTAVGPGATNEIAATGSSVAFTLDPETSIDCYWFNLPETPGVVVVAKFECSSGYTNSTPYDDFASGCTTRLSGVPFILTPGENAPTQIETDGTGEATFPNVPAGPATLDELVPAGYSLVVVFCSIDAGPYQQQTVSQTNVMEFNIGAGETWECSWFNVLAPASTVAPTPEGDTKASLTIDKYTCPEGFDLFADDVDFEEDCNLPTKDILFTLKSDATELGASTGEGGKPATIQFSDLEQGNYLLTEELPDDVEFAFVGSCTSNAREFGGYPFSPFAVVESEGRVGVELVSGEEMRCSWFNVLNPNPGTLTVVKYWCDENTINRASCELYTGGIDFRLVPDDGSAEIALTTGPDGTGTTETTGVFDLIEVGFQWCEASSDAANAEGKIVVESGDTVEIEVYNCGPRPLAN